MGSSFIIRLGIVGMLSGCATIVGSDIDAVDFASWRQTVDKVWHIDGTHLEAGPSEVTSYLVSTEQFRDVVVDVEFFIEDETNSGIFVRCNNPDSINPNDCYEINIFDNHPNQDFRTGSIVLRQAPLAMVDTLGRWNRYHVEVRGNRITVSVNGVVTADLEDDTLGGGYLALQYAGKHLVRFRNLRIASE